MNRITIDVRAGNASKCWGTFDLRNSSELCPRTWHDLPKPRRMVIVNTAQHDRNPKNYDDKVYRLFEFGVDGTPAHRSEWWAR